jgi:hypothetical protein
MQCETSTPMTSTSNSSDQLYPIGTNWRNGTDRVSYQPDWDPIRPFITYRNGKAGMHRGTLHAAILYLGAGRVNLDDWERS